MTGAVTTTAEQQADRKLRLLDSLSRLHTQFMSESAPMAERLEKAHEVRGIKAAQQEGSRQLGLVKSWQAALAAHESLVSDDPQLSAYLVEIRTWLESVAAGIFESLSQLAVLSLRARIEPVSTRKTPLPRQPLRVQPEPPQPPQPDPLQEIFDRRAQDDAQWRQTLVELQRTILHGQAHFSRLRMDHLDAARPHVSWSSSGTTGALGVTKVGG